MYNGVYAPNLDFLGAGQVQNRRLLQLARPQCAVLRYEGRSQHTHRRAHADWLHSIGCQQIIVVVNPDNDDISVHPDDVAAAYQEFGPQAVYQLSNEPDRCLSWGLPQKTLEDLIWSHKWYIEQVLAARAIRYPDAHLLCPAIQPLDRLQYQQRAAAWLMRPLGATNLLNVYRQVGDAAIHVYDWWDAGELAKQVDYYSTLYNGHRVHVTEYGITATQLSHTERVTRYRQFVGMMRGRSQVAACAMFIAGLDLPGQQDWPYCVVGDAVAGLAGA